MKHLFLPCKLALLAKEEGYTGEYLAIYPTNTKKLSFQIGKAGLNTLKDNDIWVEAPLYQQIINWFREKHSKHIEINHWLDQPVGNEMWMHCYQPAINGNNIHPRIYKTYYEALNKAIEEAFKLI